MDGICNGMINNNILERHMATQGRAEEFSQVKSKKKRNRKYVYKEKTVQDYLMVYEASMNELKASSFYEALLQAFKKIGSGSLVKRFQAVQCLALGKPSAPDRIAMWQLSLLGLIVAEFEISWSNVFIWDPVFDQIDLDIIGALGGKAKESSLGDIGAGTLVYLPHAPVSLIEAVLKQIPSYCIMFGNNLLRYDTKIPSKTLQMNYPTLDCTMKMINGLSINKECWTMIDLPDLLSKQKEWFLAVNDLALHKKSQP